MLKEWKPDIITVQTPYEEGIAGYFLSRWIKSKYLLQLHFDIFSEYWIKEHWLNRFRRLVSFWVIKRADGIRVVSRALKENLINQLNISKEKISIVPVGVSFSIMNDIKDKNYFKGLIDKSLEEKPVVLFVGRFYAPKNLELWVDVAQKVRKTIHETCFVMAGEGTQLENIKELVRKKGLSDSFFFLGKVGHSKLPEIYASADVFLLTSSYEGFGRVVIESYLSGVPVVSSINAGTIELIKDNETGYLHDLNSEKLANSVIKLLIDKQCCLSMGQAGKKKILASYSIEVLINKLITSWETLVNKP